MTTRNLITGFPTGGAHNLFKSIHKNPIKNGGKLVFHLPMFHIIDKNNYKEYLNDDFKAFSFDY